MTRKQTYTTKKKRWHRKRYDTRFRNGLCPMCGGKRTGEWTICEACHAKSRAYSRTLTPESRQRTINRYRRKCRRTGICYGCGRYIGLGGYKRCAGCREKDRVVHAERYAHGGVSKQVSKTLPIPPVVL